MSDDSDSGGVGDLNAVTLIVQYSYACKAIFVLTGT